MIKSHAQNGGTFLIWCLSKALDVFLPDVQMFWLKKKTKIDLHVGEYSMLIF